MRDYKIFKRSVSGLAVVALAIVAVIGTRAEEKKLHNFFLYADDGNGPGGLIFDNAGNLYGTTSAGGDYSGGTVFELTRRADGGWTERKLHNFRYDGKDGNNPQCSLVMDTSGNLYGTTYDGGDSGLGTVFELSPNQRGGWTEKKLHNFLFDDRLGENPAAGLVIDTFGNLYGTARGGGDYGNGTVFELSPDGTGGWTKKTIHSFDGNDGWSPSAKLTFDAGGNLYGTTSNGGGGYGNVFELTPDGRGHWTEKTLYYFAPYGDGVFPMGAVVLDAAGNVYGTTELGGDHDSGIVFELVHSPNGRWMKKTLHNFGIDPTDGTLPLGDLIFDSAGNLYGTTKSGGEDNYGTVFKLTPRQDGGWTQSKLHSFLNNGTDGTNPVAGILLDAAGNIYGTTGEGGNYGLGTVFEITH